MGLVFGVLNELQNFQVFNGFDQKKIESVCMGGSVVVHEHRDFAFHFGEPATHFGIVLSGAYKLFKTGLNGETSILHFSTPGDILAGLIMPHANPHYPVTAQAMGPARWLRIPRATYISTWLPDPELSGRLQILMSTRLTKLHDQKALGRAPVAAKIAALLIQLMTEADNHSRTASQVQDKKSNEIPIPITRKDIADALGTTVETVIRTMSAWEKSQILMTEEKDIKILKPAELIRLSQGDPT